MINYNKLYSSELIDHSKSNFIQAWSEVKDQTLLTPDRLWHLWVLSRATMHLPGLMAECGTYMGGSARLLCKAVNHDKHLCVFDTFEGMPEQHVMDTNGCVAGDLGFSIDQVRSNLSDCSNVTLHKGVVPDSLECVQNEQFSFVYLDMDLYEPTIRALHFFWDRLVVGGVMVLDDYKGIEPLTQAVIEFDEYHMLNINCQKMETTIMQCAYSKQEVFMR